MGDGELQYSMGGKREVGAFTKSAGAATVDTATGVGFPAVFGAAGSVSRPVGAAVGAGVGGLVDSLPKVLAGKRRERVIQGGGPARMLTWMPVWVRRPRTLPDYE